MSRGLEVQAGTTLVTETCCTCGVLFAITRDLQRERRNDRERFYCPNGHWQVYTGPTDAARARRVLERANLDLAMAQADARAWRAEAEGARRSAAASRGQVTRIKRRVSRGVCPCCNRSFADLARHMTGQHPEWSEAEM